MNPELETHIETVINFHKEEPNNIINWNTLRDQLIGVSKPNAYILKQSMIEMGILKEHQIGSGQTVLINFSFDLKKYKGRQQQDDDKKDIDYKLGKQTLEDYFKVQKRADLAIQYSRLALIISGLGVLLLLIKWILELPK